MQSNITEHMSLHEATHESRIKLGMFYLSAGTEEELVFGFGSDLNI